MPTPEIPNDTRTLLWVIAGVLAGCIVALVFYIKHLHKKNEQRMIQAHKESNERIITTHKEHQTQMRETNETMVDLVREVVAAINNNSAIVDKIDGSVKSSNVLVTDLHRYIRDLEMKKT